MLGVAACCGVAVGSSVALLIRRDRSVQVVALGLLSLALAVAFLLAGAALPGLGVLLMGALAEVVLLSPSARSTPEAQDSGRIARPTALVPIVLSAVAALAALGLLVAAGVASRAELAAGAVASRPTLAQVGHQLVMGAGVAVLALALLVATTVVGGAALIQRDPREAAEEQLRQARTRRLEAQRRRQAQREAARAAARAARRRSGG